MTAASYSFAGSVPVSSSQDRDKKEAAQMSLSKVFDVREFRRFYKERSAQFFQENYDSPEQVAYLYGKRYQTALNWWTGTNAPSGDTATLMAIRHGDAYTEFMRRGA